MVGGDHNDNGRLWGYSTDGLILLPCKTLPTTPIQTNLGKLLGAACSFVGTLGIAFPIPVVVAHFNFLYNMDRDDSKVGN